MSLYSSVAVDAVSKILDYNMHPVDAWKTAAAHFFPRSRSAQVKGCPRSAFLGLCEEGYIKGVEKGNYTRSTLNKQYALKALLYLNKNPKLSEIELWKLVSNKNYNHQMHIVTGLFKADLLTIYNK